MGEKRRYFVRYTIQACQNGLDLDPENPQDFAPNDGACDAIVVCSILFDKDGGRSHGFMTLDGRLDRALPTIDLWSAWLVLAYQLSQDTSLPPAARQLCRDVHAEVQAFAIKSRSN